MTFKPTRMETATVVVVALQLASAALIATQGSTHPVPMHFNAAGEVDRWGDRIEAAWFALTLAGLTLAIVGTIAISLRTARPDAARRRGMTLALGLVLGIMAAVSLLPVVLASPSFDPASGGRLAAAILCLVLGVTGAFLGKVPPNALVGVRTPWSLSSRLSWDRSNRLAGRLFFWGGLIALPVIFLVPVHAAMVGLTSCVCLVALVVIFESWRVWRADPDRRPV